MLTKFDVKLDPHSGEGQTVCICCALRGHGTGSLCWDSSVYGVTVNTMYLGCMCGAHVKRYLLYHWMMQSAPTINVNGIRYSPDTFDLCDIKRGE